jgi:hypothetical protein
VLLPSSPPRGNEGQWGIRSQGLSPDRHLVLVAAYDGRTVMLVLQLAMRRFATKSAFCV